MYTKLSPERREFLEGLTAKEIKRAAEIMRPMSFFEPESTNLNLDELNAGFLEDTQYTNSRASLIRGGCIDPFVACQNNNGDYGILLIERQGNPAKGYTWPLGGAKKRHMIGSEDSINNIMRREGGEHLKIEDFLCLGFIDAAWGTTIGNAEYGGKGVHDEGLPYYVRTSGGVPIIMQKELEKNPIIVTPDMWDNRKKISRLKNLHVYVEENMIKSQILLKDYLSEQ